MNEPLENLPITAWAEEDRPREKLIKMGRQQLSDAELLAILIGIGNADENAVSLSRRLLSAVDNSLSRLGQLNLAEITRFKGIGQAKALSIIAALELGRRRRDTPPPKRPRITGSSDVYQYVLTFLQDIPHEEFWVLYLNRSNLVVKSELISKGGVAGTVVDTKIIFKAAIECLANAIILCHNHPSGNPKPSDPDLQITKKIKEIGKIMEIPVLDHIICCDHDYYSFADQGLL